MDVGDIIRWQSKLWLVHKIDPSTATAFIESQDNENEILGTEEDCSVICNPPRHWPAVLLPTKKGSLIRVERASPRGAIPLAWLLDWVKISEFQMGGALFLNPKLKLGFRDRLLCQNNYGHNRQYPVEIPRDFQPLSKKIVKVAQKTTANLFDHLLDDKD